MKLECGTLKRGVLYQIEGKNRLILINRVSAYNYMFGNIIEMSV